MKQKFVRNQTFGTEFPKQRRMWALWDGHIWGTSLFPIAALWGSIPLTQANFLFSPFWVFLYIHRALLNSSDIGSKRRRDGHDSWDIVLAIPFTADDDTAPRSVFVDSKCREACQCDIWSASTCNWWPAPNAHFRRHPLSSSHRWGTYPLKISSLHYQFFWVFKL